MQKLMEQLFNGDFIPMERTRPRGAEYTKKSHDEEQKEASLHARLSEELAGLFKEIILAKEELSMLEANQAFVEGFRLGVQLMVEVYACDN